MLSLKIGSTLVNTSEANIPVVLRSPVFTNDEGKIPASFIFNFTLPLTDELKRELQFAHRPARTGKPTWQHSFMLRFGVLKYAGTATIVQINSRQVEVSAPVETGSLASDLKDLTLQDLNITDAVPWDPQITFADVAWRYEYAHEQQGIFVHDVWLVPDFVRIDGLAGWNLNAHSFTAPAAGNYRVTIVVNSAFGYASHLGSQVPLIGHRSFRIYKNGTYIFYGNIDDADDPQESNNSYLHTATYTLAQGDVLTFAVYASSRALGVLHYLYLTIDPGTTISIDDGSAPFSSLPTSVFPDENYAVFPYHNPVAMDNLPDSLFQIDINDTKDYLSRFAPVVNYYRNDEFPYVVHGAVNSLYYALLNLFTPAPYLAYIINHIAAHISYSISNNLFITDELKRITILTTNFINNYFPDSGAPMLKDFLPETTLSDFLRSACRLLGIAFKTNSNTRTLTLKFIDDIIADTTSVEFSNDVVGTPELQPEHFSGYRLKTTPTGCKYIGDYFKSLDGLTIKGSVNTYALLPASGNLVNDCYYIDTWQAWFIWNYDAEEGIYNWIFHSIDHSLQVEDIDTGLHGDPLEISLQASAPARMVWKPENPAKDPTIGATIRYWWIPALQMPGNFKNLPESLQSETPYALIPYWGLQKDNSNENYPYASNDVYDYSRTKIAIANLSLLPDGDYGLYEKKWKKFIQWRLQSPGEYTITKAVTPLEIAQLDWFKWHKIHGVDYLIKEIRFNIRFDRIGTARLILYRR